METFVNPAVKRENADGNLLFIIWPVQDTDLFKIFYGVSSSNIFRSMER